MVYATCPMVWRKETRMTNMIQYDVHVQEKEINTQRRREEKEKRRLRGLDS